MNSLLDLTTAFLRDATNYLRVNCDLKTVPYAFPEESWRHLHADVFVQVWDIRPRLFACAEAHGAELRALDSYLRCVIALRSSDFRDQLDTLLGTGREARRLDSGELPLEALRTVLEESRSLDVSDELLGAVASQLVNALEDKTIEVELLIPLPRFNCDSVPVSLSPTLRIGELSEQDVSLLIAARRTETQAVDLAVFEYELHEFQEQSSLRPGTALRVTSKSAISYRYRVPKLVGDSASDGRPNEATHARAERAVLDLVRLLSLVRPGHVWVPGVLRRSTSWLFRGSYGFSGDEPNTGRDAVTFGSDDVTALQRLWSAFETDQCQQSRWLSSAVRRFALACGRYRDEDRVVDLLTTAETLFLRDSSDELSYRLATRAAFFLRRTTVERLSVFNHFRTAYSVRSDIVHGSVPRLRGLTMNELAQTTEAHVREALVAIIGLVSEGDRLENWEKSFVFGERDEGSAAPQEH